MKTFRILGAVFCVFGFIFALLGIISSILPMIENEQFKLIVNSFQETSTDALTNTLNAIVLFCLHSGYFLLFCGISLMVTGGLISASAHKKQKAFIDESPVRPVSAPTAETSDVPRPAYYPGGLAPPAIIYLSDQEESLPQVISTISPQKTAPISGGIEPSFSSEENDAQKLMRHDELLSAHKEPKRPSVPDYTKYLSNSVPANAVPDTPRELASGPQSTPRIISTVGKRRP